MHTNQILLETDGTFNFTSNLAARRVRQLCVIQTSAIFLHSTEVYWLRISTAIETNIDHDLTCPLKYFQAGTEDCDLLFRLIFTATKKTTQPLAKNRKSQRRGGVCQIAGVLLLLVLHSTPSMLRNIVTYGKNLSACASTEKLQLELYIFFFLKIAKMMIFIN